MSLRTRPAAPYLGNKLPKSAKKKKKKTPANQKIIQPECGREKPPASDSPDDHPSGYQPRTALINFIDPLETRNWCIQGAIAASFKYYTYNTPCRFLATTAIFFAIHILSY